MPPPSKTHRTLATALKKQGLSGKALSTALTTAIVAAKEEESRNKCPGCWHDKASRCICAVLPSLPPPTVSVSATILIHHKEYFSAGDDAKLLPIMCRKGSVSLVVYGVEGWEAKVKAFNPEGSDVVVLWPGAEAKTVSEWQEVGVC